MARKKILRKFKNVDLYSFYFFILYFLSLTDISVFSIKLFYFISLPLLIKTLIQLFTNDHKRFDKCIIYLFIWIVSYFLAWPNIFSITDFIKTTLGQCVLIVYLLYFYFNIPICKIKQHLNIFLYAIFIFAIIGIIQVAVFYLFDINLGVSHMDHGSLLPRPRSFASEPDWYGLICGLGVVISITFYIMNKSNKKLMLLIFFTSFTGLLISLTRASWVAVGVALVFMYLFLITQSEKKKINMVIKQFLVFGFIVFVALLIINPSVLNKLFTRLNIFGWLSNDGGASDSRMSAIQVMIIYIKQNPFFGNGVGSMNTISLDTELLSSLGFYYEINKGSGNANIFITNLFDCGIFGTIFLIAFLFRYFSKTYLTIKKRNIYREDNIVSMACFLVSIVELIDFQFNNGLRLPFVWIIFGMACSFINSEKKNFFSKKNISKKLL